MSKRITSRLGNNLMILLTNESLRESHHRRPITLARGRAGDQLTYLILVLCQMDRLWDSLTYHAAQ